MSNLETRVKRLEEILIGQEPPILVYSWDNAPAKFRALSKHGGDEDWVAFVPDAYKDKWIGWLESGSSFGCCDVSIDVVEGGKVYIGAHS